jgi:hypothetical protein
VLVRGEATFRSLAGDVAGTPAHRSTPVSLLLIVGSLNRNVSFRRKNESITTNRRLEGEMVKCQVSGVRYSETGYA